ncbi:MAG: hypothetical protein M3Y54_00930 [Bacteroidota bacterium]|nr:hypothetical protein [Bacteroidota bacterium]
MPTTTDAPTASKGAYQRPYKTRSQRREDARRKHDENGDQKFLLRAAVVAGLLVLLALAFALKGFADRQQEAPTAIEEVR